MSTFVISKTNVKTQPQDNASGGIALVPSAARQGGSAIAGAVRDLGRRRAMMPEQGRALESIGHAVDYLNDCYLHEGPDGEILDFRSPSMEAVQMLIAAQWRILESLPLADSFPSRLWNGLRRRKPQRESARVVPLTSSR